VRFDRRLHPVACGLLEQMKLSDLMKQTILLLRILIGAAVGAGLGFGWYRFFGCSIGTCPLTSNPVISTIYGAGLGVMPATSFH
jgi:hypothetical protein